MDSATAHTDEFLRNAEEIMESLISDLEDWKKDPYNRHLIDRIFRYMHSLKSGAAFLEMSTLESLAHSLESLFDSYRRGAETDEATIGKVMKAQSIMSRELDRLLEENLPPLVDFSHSGEDRKVEESSLQKRDLFSPFEKELLGEASRRGEKLYRIICHLDEFPQMLYARAYLLMNNLELSVNVIATNPPMDDRKADFSRFTAYITTDLDESGIYKAVNVDSVVRVDLIRLDYASYLERDDDVINLNFDEDKAHPAGSWIRVEQRKVDELAGYIEQLKVSTGRFSSYRTKMDDLHALARGMERVLLDVTMVPLNTLLKGFPRFVEELCRKTGKSAELIMSGESCTVDRTVFDIISETLQHLIRNAVYHGLEKFDQRRKAGKSESGSLVIHTEMSDELIHITISDDGRGIDREKVLERASKLGLRERGDGDLLSILAKPGFSTVEEADSLSGRGVGLDLVLHNIQDKLKGEIELINDEGRGVTYKIVIPTSRVMTKILLMRSGGRTMAFPARNVDSTLPFNIRSLTGEREDFLYYRYGEEELPLYTESGRLHHVSEGFEGGYILIVTYLGLKAAIYTEELLMEKEILSDNLRLNEEAEPFLYKAVLSGEDCLYLSPSIISI
ncbi:MAG: Hpt domain-containing protein [Spirochaetales bacterium]|nr:Hpt domain-containing protein [Spirochaetales bacterium]